MYNLGGTEMKLKQKFAELRPIEVDENTFKKEWDVKDEKRVNKAVMNLFRGKTMIDEHHQNKKYTFFAFSQVSDFLGLPYTSTSSFAMISNCNTECFIDEENQYNIEFFALTEDNKVMLGAWGRDEEQLYFEI
jgi:hypothetical protein